MLYEVITRTIASRGDSSYSSRITSYNVCYTKLLRLGVILAYETFEKEMMNRKWVSQVDEMHEYFGALEYPFLGVTYSYNFV